ncbi:MAG TPA: hypothetical protein VGH48_03450 [Caldimonas sp.]
MRTSLAALCATALVLTAAGSAGPPMTTAAAPTTPAAPPKTALWVGNSFFYYNNSMHGHVERLLSAANPGVRGYGRSPVGNHYTAGLPADIAAQLQATAWQTVQSFKQPI